MYIDRANNCLACMKTTHFFLLSLVVGLMSLAPAEEWAAEATDVAVSLDQSRTGGGPDISLLPRLVGEAEIFKGCKLAPHSGLEDKGDKAWYVLNIPLKINARGRDKESGKRVPAHYIDELNLEICLLVTKPSKGNGKGGGLERFREISCKSGFRILHDQKGNRAAGHPHGEGACQE